MQLSRYTDYSLRVLFYVASHPERLVTLAETANYYSISIEHLRKVVHALSKAGYLSTFRGKNGGIQLGKEPGEINIGNVISYTESHPRLIDCSTQGCRLTGLCQLEGVLAEAYRAFMSVLQRYTLEDLLDSPTLQQELIAKQ